NRRAARPRVTIDPSLPGVPDEPETDWRPIQRAWSIFEAWRRWTPRNADAHRHLHRQDEKAWLEKVAVDGRSLKATLDSLERELASVRAILAAQPDRESLNRKFMADFQFELARLRERAARGKDFLACAHFELEKFHPILARLGRNIENGAGLGL